jgi:hypothetical protein
MGKRRVVLCLEGHGQGHSVRALELAWVRDNVILPNDEVDLMHVRPQKNRTSFSGLVRSALSPKEGTDSAARDLACDVETYNSLFGTRRLREIKGSRPLQELVQDLRSGLYDLVVCSTGKPLRYLQSSLTTLSDDAGSELFNVPIVVLPKFNTGLKSPSPGKSMPRKIGVGVSGSPDSFHAFSWAMHHLVRPGDTMVITTHTDIDRDLQPREICVCPPSFSLLSHALPQSLSLSGADPH